MLVLIVGEPNTGKTVSACTFPKPALFLDINNGFKSVLHTRDKHGNLVVPDHDQIDISKFYKYGSYDLNLNTADKTDFKVGKPPAHAQFSHDVIGKYNTIIRELNEDGKVPAEMIEKDGDSRYPESGPYQTLIVDSLTDMWRLLKEAILFANRIPQLRIADYGTLESILFGQMLPTLKLLQQKIPWIVLLDHEDIEKDELQGGTYEFPSGPSRAMGRQLAKDFDETWRQVVEGDKHIWRTRAHGRFASAGSRLSLPDRMEATYYELKKHVKEV